VIARQVTGRGAPIWGIFVAGGAAVAALGVLPISGVASALTAAGPTLIFLFALFLFAGALQSSGAVEHLAHWLVGRARRPRDLPFVLFCGVGLVSAVVVNDPLVLIGVPILVGLAGRLRTDPKPLLLVLAFSVSIGSTLTPFGNPQDLLVAAQSGITSPVATFLRYLAVPTAVNLVLGGWYLRRVYGPSMPAADVEYVRLRSNAPALLPQGGWRFRLLRHPVLWVFPGTMIVLVTLDLTAALTHGPTVPFWETTLAGAAVLLCLTPARARTLRHVNWSILLLFAGLFVVVAGAVQGGVVSTLAGFVPIPGPGHPTAALLATVGTSAIGSQFVSNVPWVALQIPVLSSLGYGSGTPVVWMALAGGATLAGNVSLLGAVSNLIVVETAEKHGVQIRLGEFVRHGLPIAALTLAVLVVCLGLGL
jgi:Na+/H+ antiporter NhaD/arsenite permease-like protein